MNDRSTSISTEHTPVTDTSALAQIPSYDSVLEKMSHFYNDAIQTDDVRFQVFTWAAEFSEFSYACMKDIIEIIHNESNYGLVGNYSEKVIIESKRETIKCIGLQIYQRGGMIALQAAYYIMVNFMSDNVRVRDVEYYWHNVGDWLC